MDLAPCQIEGLVSFLHAKKDKELLSFAKLVRISMWGKKEAFNSLIENLDRQSEPVDDVYSIPGFKVSKAPVVKGS